MSAAGHVAKHASTARVWLDGARIWLARFPLSIIQLAMRIAVGAVFLNSGLLKINSWEFAIKLFQDEYKVPLLDPVWAARLATLQRAHILSSLDRWPGDAHCHTAVARDDRGDPDVRLSTSMDRTPALGFDPGLPADPRTRRVIPRLSHRAMGSEAGTIANLKLGHQVRFRGAASII